MSPVRLAWIPPHSSIENGLIVTTRTTSPYFSPNNAIAPLALADSISISSVTIGWLARIWKLTKRSTSASCALLIASGCTKSKRNACSCTKEPFCATWSPSTWRKALCNKWVALWFKAVFWRRCSSTLAFTVWPTESVPRVNSPMWPNTWPYFWVSFTSK